MLVAFGLLAACSDGGSSNPPPGSDGGTGSDAGSSVTGLDGTWDIVFTAGIYTTGTMVISGGDVTIDLTGYTGPCDKSGTTHLAATVGNDATTLDGADTCKRTFSFQRTSQNASQYGQLGGGWTSPSGCSVLVTGTKFSGACPTSSNAYYKTLGTVLGTLSADGNTITGQSVPTDGSGTFEFAATRH